MERKERRMGAGWVVPFFILIGFVIAPLAPAAAMLALGMNDGTIRIWDVSDIQ